MPRLLSVAGLGRASARHPWRVLGVWLVAVIVAGYLATGLSDVTTTEVTFTNEPESVKGYELLEQRLRGEPPLTETVIITSPSLTVDDAAFREVVERATAELTGMTNLVASAVNYYTTGSEELVADDRHTTILRVTLIGQLDDVEEPIKELVTAVESLRSDEFQTYVIGPASLNNEWNAAAEDDLARGEAIGIGAALVILVIVFGALVAAGVPLVLGLVAIVVAIGLSALVGRLFELTFMITNIITMLGLAVGIDYSLFIVERYREERRHGYPKLDAITIAAATASKAVIFSASTVVLALSGMFLIPATVFRSIAAGSILVVVSAAAAMLTLIPALLGLLGDRIDWPRRGHYPGTILNAVEETAQASARGFWGRATHVVMARPVLSVFVAVAVLLALAAPYLDLERGWPGAESLPASDPKAAFAILERDFAAGMLDPVEIAIEGDASDPRVQAGVEALVAALRADPTYAQVADPQWNEAGDVGLVSALLAMDPNSPEADQAIMTLRETTIPKTMGGAGAKVYVTGIPGFNRDFFAAIDRSTPIVFAFVLGLSFLLLMLVFHSIVVPIKAILMNLLSVGATYGLLVLVFQKGYGADLFGFTTTPTIIAWLPLFVFCILFGLSMDYHVFLLSRIREHYQLTHNNRESVAVGLQSTAKIITGAATIMVAVFSGFALSSLVPLQQLGFGLAVAVFMDATIVRSILVPSTMALLGDLNWYFPRWLRWMPDLGKVHGGQAPAGWP